MGHYDHLYEYDRRKEDEYKKIREEKDLSDFESLKEKVGLESIIFDLWRKQRYK